MPEERKNADQSGVDKGLAMFIRMSPEERLQANDRAFFAILELRDTCRRRENKGRKPK